MSYKALNTAEHFATTIEATFVAAGVSAVIMESVLKCWSTTIDSASRKMILEFPRLREKLLAHRTLGQVFKRDDPEENFGASQWNSKFLR